MYWCLPLFGCNYVSYRLACKSGPHLLSPSSLSSLPGFCCCPCGARDSRRLPAKPQCPLSRSGPLGPPTVVGFCDVNAHHAQASPLLLPGAHPEQLGSLLSDKHKLLLFLVPTGVPVRSGDATFPKAMDNVTVRQGESATLRSGKSAFGGAARLLPAPSWPPCFLLLAAPHLQRHLLSGARKGCVFLQTPPPCPLCVDGAVRSWPQAQCGLALDPEEKLLVGPGSVAADAWRSAGGGSRPCRTAALVPETLSRQPSLLPSPLPLALQEGMGGSTPSSPLDGPCPRIVASRASLDTLCRVVLRGGGLAGLQSPAVVCRSPASSLG
ncbi:hypothetical protein CB1_000568084 [Camelus ferus]|nr:hypothetical protein CB1_000568084 [Camelus ferus]